VVNWFTIDGTLWSMGDSDFGATEAYEAYEALNV
jgi:hypothetical protein